MLWTCLLPALLMAVLVALTPASVSAEATVRGIRLVPDGDVTRVVLDLSRKVAFRHLSLADPPRLAIDLPEVAWLVPESIGAQSVGLVKGYRFGLFRPGTSRLVLDLAGPFEIKNVFALPARGRYGHRIVAEIAPTAAHENGPPGAWPKAIPAAGDGSANGVHLAALPGAGAGEPAPVPAGTQQIALAVPLRKPPVFKPLPVTVVIDPGHGGRDPGAIGTGGVYEKDVVLKVALDLKRQLERRGPFKVVMTRDDDSTLRLRDRLAAAREAEGEFFISLHADSLKHAPGVRGAAVYTLSDDASNREAARLATKENRADILAGIDLTNHEDLVTQILIDLAQRDANHKALRAADLLVEELGEVAHLVRDQRQQAGFVVLKSPDMPSVLVELGYLSNTADEELLSDPAHIGKLAQAMARAIDHFFTPDSS